jgi:hypothetical protein
MFESTDLRMISSGYLRKRATMTPNPTMEAISASVTNSWTTISQPGKVDVLEIQEQVIRF